MDARLLEAADSAMVTTLLLMRERSLSEPSRALQGAAEVLFAAQAWDIVRAVYDADGSEDLDTILVAVAAALARRERADAIALAKGYEPAVLAALRAVERRWGVIVDLLDIGAAAWISGHAEQTLQGLNATTVDRLRVPLRDADDRSAAGLATAAAVAISAMGVSRAGVIGPTEALFGYGYGELASAGAFESAGVPMLKRWHHTDGCPCSECTMNDGVIVRVRDPFPSGAMGVPAHPHCRCYVDIYPDTARIALPLLVLGQTPIFADGLAA